MNKTMKPAIPMKVITGPDTRWSYANVWEPKSINGGTPKYSVSLIIPKSDTKTLVKIKAAIEAAYKEGEGRLKGNGKSVPALSAIKTPLRDGDTERPDDPAYSIRPGKRNPHGRTECEGLSLQNKNRIFPASAWFFMSEAEGCTIPQKLSVKG